MKQYTIISRTRLDTMSISGLMPGFGGKLCNKQDRSKLVWLRKQIENMGFLPISSSITKSGHEPSLFLFECSLMGTGKGKSFDTVRGMARIPSYSSHFARDALFVQKTLAEVKDVVFRRHWQKENALFSRVDFR